MRKSISIALALLGLESCAGVIDGSGSETAGGGTESPSPGAGGGARPAGPSGGSPAVMTAEVCNKPGTAKVGPSPLRRLSKNEYSNAIRDLLGITAAGNALASDGSLAAVGQLDAERYMESAETLAQTAVKNLPALVGCNPTAGSELGCARQFIASFGRRAFRRPLSAEQSAALEKAYAAGVPNGGFARGIELVLRVILQSPEFLYRLEVGAPAQAGAALVPLDGYDLAARLSFMIWSSIPDDELLAAAGQGRLATPEQIATQARRMLQDPRAKEMVDAFAHQWLDLDALARAEKDAKLYKAFTPALKEEMRKETAAFFQHVAWNEDARALFEAPYSFISAPLATHYQMTPTAGTALVRTPLDVAKRAGLLTQGSFLSVNSGPDRSSPLRRGKFVRETLLCQIPPPPPPDVDNSLPPTKPDMTTREQFAAHTANARCANCHLLLDPIGFGLENLDAIGRWRDTDAGKPVDASGEITGTDDVNGPFVGGVALGKRLAGSAQVQNCYVTHWFRFNFGRDETAADACALGSLQKSFSAGGRRIPDLLVQFTQVDAFRFRNASE